MYKLMHLPTGTFVQVKIFNKPVWVDWVFHSKDSIQKVAGWEIVADYEKEIVCLRESTSQLRNWQAVLSVHLEIVEVEDDG